MLTLSMKYIMLFLVVSCQSQEAKKENGLASITYSLISLEGIDEIYTVTENVIKVKGQKDKIIGDSELVKLENVPKIITQKDGKYGCGVCTDGVDHKFIFNFKNGKTTTWEIEPDIKLPAEIDEYFKILVKKYNEIVVTIKTNR